jgi:hypothetical protein
MKFSAILALASGASAHYVFPALTNGAGTTPDWSYVRQWTGYYTNGPVTTVSTDDIRCNVGASSPSVGATTNTLTVAAGSTVGFTAKTSITHPGPLQFYLAKVPAGQTAKTWDGSGSVWFKIYGQGPTFSGGQLVWPTMGTTLLLTFDPFLSTLLSPFPKTFLSFFRERSHVVLKD